MLKLHSRLLVWLALLLVHAPSTGMQGCDPADEQPLQASSSQSLQAESWLRIETPAPGKLRGLLQSKELDVTGSNHRLGFVDVVLTETQKADTLAEFSELITSSHVLAWPARDKALSDYHAPAEIEARLDSIQASYPDIARKVLLADNLPEGGSIWAMKISDQVDLDEDEPTFLIDGQIHAREVMTAEVMLDAIEYLTSRYATDPQVRRWVDEMEIWIVPVVNPDGANFVHSTQPMWRKNRSHDCGAFPGVDLNRNFEWNYRQCSGSDDVCSSDIYHGPAAASEIETQTMQALMLELRPMYYINYHSYGEYILWSSGCGAVDEDALLRSVGEELNDIVRNDDGLTGQWTTGPAGIGLYTAPGGSDDFAYGAAGAVAFTFELNAGSFQPDYRTWRDRTVIFQRDGWMHLLDRTLDGPSLRGHTFDEQNGTPVQATYRFADHPFTSGQWDLQTDAQGRFGRAVLPQTAHRLVFTAAGYLPEVRDVEVGDGPLDLSVPMRAGVNQAPSAQIEAPNLVNEGDEVVLDGSQSADPDGDLIFYSWSQVAGPEAFFDDASLVQIQFTAPAVDQDTDLIFELVVSDGQLSSPATQVTVRVRDMWDDLEVEQSQDTPLSIPDDDPNGVISIIHFTTDRRVLRARAQVDITHTFIGELRISLISPAQTRVLLHDMSGGSANNIHTEYLVPEVVGEWSAGDWTLEIIDQGFGDLGTLEGWQLRLDLEGDADCELASDCQLHGVSEATCVDGRCEIIHCDSPWLDCNTTTHDGCEANPLTDDSHCGGCGQSCDFPHGFGECQNGHCVLIACQPDFQDCNLDDSDGCEAWLTSDPDHCGACDQACNFPNAQALCRSGLCVLGPCEGLFGNCDGLQDNGCEEDLSANIERCGACDLTCLLAQAEAECRQGRCLIARCEEGWGDCDQIDSNGCESALGHSTLHCGACFNSCARANTVSHCEEGQCVVDACQGSFRDCNHLSQDGCEADMRSDPENCGACGNSCGLPHARVACQERVCAFLGCESNFGDCNQNLEDGCEQDLLTSLEHCGACHQACQPARAEGECQTGRCEIATCQAGWGDCNLRAQDGCETELQFNDQHCGSCGNICSRGSHCIAGFCDALCPDQDSDGFPSDSCGGQDCDDQDASIHPGAPEVCNGRDDDCDGLTDEDCPDDGEDPSCGCSGGHAAGDFIWLIPALLGWMQRKRGRQR